MSRIANACNVGDVVMRRRLLFVDKTSTQRRHRPETEASAGPLWPPLAGSSVSRRLPRLRVVPRARRNSYGMLVQ
jgi:hypothetical protein